MNYKNIKLFVLNQLSWFLILITYIAFSIFKPKGMLQFDTIIFIIYSTIPLGFLVFGAGIILISGKIDLSIAQITGFTAMLSGLIITEWFKSIPPPFDILIPIIIGGLCGLINGILVGILGLDAFLTTMGTYIVFDGATLLLKSFPIYDGFSDAYLNIGGLNYISIPSALIILFLINFFLTKTPFGTHIYAVGGNHISSLMLGINTKLLYTVVYTISGVFAGLSALFYTGFIQAVPPGLADGNVFLAFAGAIIGGISITGGKGSMINAFAGIIFLGVVDAGLSMFNVTPYLRIVINGLLVIFAILLNKQREKMIDRLLLPN